jgi:hypothetical protein
MITSEGQLICDQCGAPSDMLSCHGQGAWCHNCAPKVELFLNDHFVGNRIVYPDGHVSLSFYGAYNKLRYNWLWRMFESDVTLTHVTDPFEK